MNHPHYFDYSKGMNLSETEHAILAFMIHDSQNELPKSIRFVAKELSTSTATIIRLCKKIGFSGYAEFTNHLRLQHIKENPTFDMNQVQDLFTDHYQTYLTSLHETMRGIDALKMIEFKRLITTSSGIVIVVNQPNQLIVAEYLQLSLQERGFYAVVISPKETTEHFKNKLVNMGLLIILTEAEMNPEFIEKLETAKNSQIPVIAFHATTHKLNSFKRLLAFDIISPNNKNEKNSFNSIALTMVDLLVTIL